MSASQYRPARRTTHASSSTDRTEPYEYFGCGCYESSWELARGVQVSEEKMSVEEFELYVLIQSLPPLNLAS